MKYLSKYGQLLNESNILTEEDISDYFLDFIDSKDLVFDRISNSLVWNNEGAHMEYSTVSIIYKMNERFVIIKDLTTLNEYTEFIQRITSICKRWKLNFVLNNGGRNNFNLHIIQKNPDYITEFIRNSMNVDIHVNFKFRFSFEKPSLLYTLGDVRIGFVVDRQLNYFIYILGAEGKYKPEEIIEMINRKLQVNLKFIEKKTGDYVFQIMP